MADKMTKLFDAEIRSVLQTAEAHRKSQELRDEVAALEAADPNYGKDHLSSSTAADQDYYDAQASLADRELLGNGRDFKEHAQDAGAGLLGTFGTIGNTLLLGGSVGIDAVDHLVRGDDANWDTTVDSLERMNSGREFTTSLQSAKSDAFDRITQRRQQQAIDQAKLEGGNWAEQQLAAAGSAVGSYLEDPGQIVTDGIAQLPYALTGGVAKIASPLLGRLTAKMSTESAQKLIQMGIVGGLQGTIEGADAAASAYERVMSSTETFGSGANEEADMESAALEAAAKAFGIAGAVSAVTGTLASKFELAPFGTKGGTVLSRSSDNLVKALQEGVQESIESGNSQFAVNYAGNTVLPYDQVALEEGTGAAAGTGAVVGAGSTVITNPRALVDATVAPFKVAQSVMDVVGAASKSRERRKDLVAVTAAANDLVDVATPAVASIMAKSAPVDVDGNELTTDTAAEKVIYPPEVITDKGAFHRFASGMEYLKGKNMDSEDGVMAWHVLGTVMKAAVVARNARDNLTALVNDPAASPEEKAEAQATLGKLKSVVNEDLLKAWVDQMPMENINGYLDQLTANPGEFGSAVAQLAKYNPMKVTSKMLDAALPMKGLRPSDQRSLLLAKELQEAAGELKVMDEPNSEEVTRSMMQTGFPGYQENDSIGGYISGVTTALAEGDEATAQNYFNRLVKFANFEQGRAAAYEAANKQMKLDPDSKKIELTGYFQLGKNGKLDRTKPQFLHKKALDLVNIVRKDADAISKMQAALSKRTGLQPVTKASVSTPAATKAPAATVAPAKPAKAAPAAKTPAETMDKTDPGNLTDQELDTAIAGSRAGFRQSILVKERDRRIANTMAGVSDRTESKPAAKKPAAKPAASMVPVTVALKEMAAEIAALTEATVVEEPTVDAPAEAAIAVDPSRNHLTDLQPGYTAADGASVAEQNDAKNHLAQSFTTSDRPGMLSKLSATVFSLSLVGEDAEIGQKIFAFKDRLINRLQAGIAAKFPKTKRMAMLKGQNFWKEENAHSLYAAVWNEAGIAYNKTVADVMAWTGVQHLLDMVYPVSWSADKQAVFLATYGDAILPMLQQGWVPLPDQVAQVAQKLQTNLELVPDSTVSTEFTDGTMLSLAMDTLSTLMGEEGDLEVKQVAMLSGPLVQWVRVTTDIDLLHAAARTMEGFFPERATTAAGIVAAKPEKVNPFYRSSRQKVGKEQRKALLKMSQTEHKLSPLLSKLWAAMPDDMLERLFGQKAVTDSPVSYDEIARDGANRTLHGDLSTIGAHIRALIAHAGKQEEETDITSIPSYFEYEMVVNGRAMTKGTSPQSSKAYREMFSTVQRMIDPSEVNRGFLMAVAQGFGIKMDKQPVNTSLDDLAAMLRKPEIQAALVAAQRFGEGDMSQLEDDVAAFEQSGIEITPHAISAFVHMAAYQKGQPFQSSLSYEIDGLTDGPINLMMLLGLRGSATKMEHLLGLGGLWFGAEKIAVQDKLEQIGDWFNKAKDLYEIIAARASEINNEKAAAVLKSLPEIVRDEGKTEDIYGTRAQGKRYMQAVLHIMHITELSVSNLEELTAKHKRSFTKKPTQAAGYMQGSPSIINDLTKTMLEALSKRIDSKDENGEPLMTKGDWAAVDVLLSNKLGYSDKTKKHFLVTKASSFKGLSEWQGEPLNNSQFKALSYSLSNFGGFGLANATLETIGYQRTRMSEAVALVNAHINYAQEKLQAAYKAKQDEEVAKGNLHENQALSKKDEQALITQIWESLIPHPMLRNTGGLPSSSTSRNNVPLHTVRRVQSILFDRQNLQTSEASFESPGVSFAALSIMAAGDGSMMTGFFGKTKGNYLNMFDGVYIDPSDIDAVHNDINKEVKQNWEHDYIGAVLGSLKMQDEGLRAWAKTQNLMVNEDGEEISSLWKEMEEAVKNLTAQQKQQIAVMKDINSRDHSTSHMAGAENSYWQAGTALNSTTLGTSVTDPLLDLASDELGNETNGIRKMSSADVKALLRDHTFENPVLSGLWKVLAPLVGDNLTLFMSSDKQSLAEFYEQNERREMDRDADGVSIGDRVYIRAINAETIVHELLHATTKNLTATFFASPGSLTAQQRTAMTNLVALQAQFMEMGVALLAPHQRAMVEHVRAIMSGLDSNSAMQEFLAYGLSNYHLQRTLGNTKSTLGKMLESVFNAVKALFGFPKGTQSDSMLAAMFSNFEALTSEAAGVIYPVMVETALNSINPNLARSFSEVIDLLQKRRATRSDTVKARRIVRTRVQEMADSNLFQHMTPEQHAATEYLQAVIVAGIQINAADTALLTRVVDAIRNAGPDVWQSNQDPAADAKDLAQARFEFFFQRPTDRYDRVANIMSMALVNPELNEHLQKIVLPQLKIEKSSFDNLLDTTASVIYEKLGTGLQLKKDSSLSDALELAATRMQDSMLASVKNQQNNNPNTYRKITDTLTEGVQWLGAQAGKTAEARLKLKGNKDWISSMFVALAGTFNDDYADMLGKMTLELTNQLSVNNPAREAVQEMTGTNSSNFRLIQLKGIATRMISAIRQSFREQTPELVKSWFNDLTPEYDALLHKVIGKMAIYSLSQDLKNRLPDLLTESGVRNAIIEQDQILMNSGDRSKRALMIKHAKRLGNRMANGGSAVYLNTQAIAGLGVENGAGVLSAIEMTALENLSTLQALSQLTPTERRATLALYRENTEGFWKTAALINSFFDFDTKRAEGQTATMNFQKGWIPVETDGRKKLKLFERSEVRAAERMGWVEVPGASSFKEDSNLVYMATTVGKTPVLSGGAIHAVDYHMNGIHFQSGLPMDPSIQTIISHPKAMREIQARIIKGEDTPYSALYDAEGDVVGFQRLLDPAMMDRHTKTVGRISDAAGIWLGRLHEENVAYGQNQAAVNLLRDTWKQAVIDKEEGQFVNIRNHDKVLGNVWQTLPYHTKVQLEKAFANGSKNPPIWIRKDQLNDAIGYHKAGVGNFFTGDNRYKESTNNNIAALTRQFLGKGAYKYLVVAEEGWQAIIGSAKDTIIVKSLTVALNNLASNQIQLFMITGNPVWNLRVQSQKHKELVSYLGYQQRIARLAATKMATTDANLRKQIEGEQAFLKNEIHKLSIWPLIEAGELPTIAEGLSETEEFSMVGDLTAWLEGQMGKLPSGVSTVFKNIAVSKDTSIYKGLDRMVQYGDFVAKAAMYEWLTTHDAASKTAATKLYAADTNPDRTKRITMTQALHQVALMEVNDEFVNYSRLPGRWRTYGEDMGLLWFYNYKLRIMKMGFRRIRKNPAAFLIGAQVGGMLGIPTLLDSLPGMANFAYSTGIDPLFTAHKTVWWNQLF